MPGILIQADGSARNNPGPAGIGVAVIGPDGTVIREISRAIGNRTNNQAEYEAVICAFTEARRLVGQAIVLQTDSELVYRQILGQYRVRNARLKPLHARAAQLLRDTPGVTFRLGPRTENRQADRLAQAASAT